MNCYYHPEVEAVATCSNCGKAICQDCAVDVGGQFQCRQCISLLNTPKPSTISAAPILPTNKMSTTSLLLGIGGWVFFCFNYTIGPLLTIGTLGLGLICSVPLNLIQHATWISSLITGHIALKQLKEREGIEKGRGMAKAGLIMSYIQLGIVAIYIILTIIAVVFGLSIPFMDQIFQQFNLN